MGVAFFHNRLKLRSCDNFWVIFYIVWMSFRLITTRRRKWEFVDFARRIGSEDGKGGVYGQKSYSDIFFNKWKKWKVTHTISIFNAKNQELESIISACKFIFY